MSFQTFNPNRIQLTSPKVAMSYHSDVRVYDAATGKLKRIEPAIYVPETKRRRNGNGRKYAGK